MNFKEVKETEMVKKEEEKDGTEEPPSKMFFLDTEGEPKPEVDDGEIKDDAVS